MGRKRGKAAKRETPMQLHKKHLETFLPGFPTEVALMLVNYFDVPTRAALACCRCARANCVRSARTCAARAAPPAGAGFVTGPVNPNLPPARPPRPSRAAKSAMKSALAWRVVKLSVRTAEEEEASVELHDPLMKLTCVSMWAQRCWYEYALAMRFVDVAFQGKAPKAPHRPRAELFDATGHRGVGAGEFTFPTQFAEVRLCNSGIFEMPLHGNMIEEAVATAAPTTDSLATYSFTQFQAVHETMLVGVDEVPDLRLQTDVVLFSMRALYYWLTHDNVDVRRVILPRVEVRGFGPSTTHASVWRTAAMAEQARTAVREYRDNGHPLVRLGYLAAEFVDIDLDSAVPLL